VIRVGDKYIYNPKGSIPRTYEKYRGATVEVVEMLRKPKIQTNSGKCWFTDAESLDPLPGEPAPTFEDKPIGEYVEHIITFDEEDVAPFEDTYENKIHPDHYTAGMEPIDYIRTFMSREEFNAFCTGNVIKYVTRHNKKNGLEDLKKAARYIQYMIDYEDDKNAEA